MDYSRYLSEQQAEAPPPQKYGLPEEDQKAGLYKRFSAGLLLTGIFVLLKDVLFGWGQPATARADGVTNGDPVNRVVEPPSLAVVATSPPNNQSDSEDNPGTDLNLASSASASGGSLLIIDRPIIAEPVYLQSNTDRPLAVANDNEPVGPAVGSNVNDLPPQVGNRVAGSGSDNNLREFDNTQNLDDDMAIDDPRLAGNRAPVVTSPARLNNLLVNQTLIITTASLLQNASDADGDVLSVQNLAASSGNLVEMGNGTWSFIPELNDTTDVTFTYDVTDGIELTPQTALLDLLPMSGKTFVGTDAPDTIIGTPYNDIINADGGDDTVFARGGDDIIDGGDGDERILAGEGDDVIFGGAGNDVIFGGGGDDVVFGGDGADTIFGGDGNDVLLGENGQDLISAGGGDDLIDGGANADKIEAEGGDDRIIGGSGPDIIDGGAGNDQFIATISDGNDSYSGGAGADTYDLSGTEADAIVDLAAGTASSSQTGTDSLSGIENVVGGAGNDIFKANEFLNVFTGGEGDDTYEFSGILNSSAIRVVRDQITDFHVGDKIDLSGFDTNWQLADNTDFELVVDKLEFSDSGKINFRFEGFGDDERTVVEGRIDENGEFDFEIELNGHHNLTKDDFIGVS